MVIPSDDLIEKVSSNSLPPTGCGIVIDIGTGDGTFVYQSARRNPGKFYIGTDPSPRPLANISEKIHRRPAKGGLANVLFVQAAVEDLPSELDGVADEVHIHFPWGSLLRAVAAGEEVLLSNIRRICAPEALLEVVVALDPERDRTRIERLGVSPLSDEFLDSVLVPRYRAAGFTISEKGRLSSPDWPRLHTSWAGRLRVRTGRSLVYIVARVLS